MYYAFYCEDAIDSFEKRRSIRPAHLKYLETLNSENRLLLAGPLLANEMTESLTEFKGSLIVAEFDNITQAKAWIAADPYVTAGVFASINVHPFKRVYP